MTIGEHKPKTAENRCWKDCMAVLLDEVMTALEESFAGLSDQQVWVRPLPQRHSIGTMLMHCLGQFNGFACWAQGGSGVEGLEELEAFDMWSHTPAELDELQKAASRPSVAQMAAWAQQLRQKALEGLSQAGEDDLRGNRADFDWCRRTKRPAGDAYLRTAFHLMSHIRQIWCLRGVIGAFGETAWPQQHYA